MLTSLGEDEEGERGAEEREPGAVEGETKVTRLAQRCSHSFGS